MPNKNATGLFVTRSCRVFMGKQAKDALETAPSTVGVFVSIHV